MPAGCSLEFVDWRLTAFKYIQMISLRDATDSNWGYVATLICIAGMVQPLVPKGFLDGRFGTPLGSLAETIFGWKLSYLQIERH